MMELAMAENLPISHVLVDCENVELNSLEERKF
jgi:hypothetical protein